MPKSKPISLRASSVMHNKKDFDSWVSWVFDHSVTDPAWHWQTDAPEMELPSARLAEYVALLFENAGPSLDRYSGEQLAQGFWFLVDTSCSDQLRVWFDESVSWDLRKRGIVATEALFRDIFARRGSRHFTNESDGPALDVAGYMWWDIVAMSSHRPNTDSTRVHLECIDAMTRILEIDSPVCAYSALHGLGHWMDFDEQRAGKAIDKFLARGTGDERLKQYALSARKGCVP